MKKNIIVGLLFFPSLIAMEKPNQPSKTQEIFAHIQQSLPTNEITSAEQLVQSIRNLDAIAQENGDVDNVLQSPRVLNLVADRITTKIPSLALLDKALGILIQQKRKTTPLVEQIMEQITDNFMFLTKVQSYIEKQNKNELEKILSKHNPSIILGKSVLLAIDFNNYNIVKALLQKYKNPINENVEGFNISPFMYLLYQNNPNLEIMKLFLDNGAPVNLVDDNGRNILQQLVEVSDDENGIIGLVPTILSKGLDLNHQDDDGFTVFSDAIAKNYITLFGKLLELATPSTVDPFIIKSLYINAKSNLTRTIRSFNGDTLNGKALASLSDLDKLIELDNTSASLEKWNKILELLEKWAKNNNFELN